MQHLSSVIHVHSLNCAFYFPLLGYPKYGHRDKIAKNQDFFEGAPIGLPLGAFLRDIGGKTVGISQCLAVGKTLCIDKHPSWLSDNVHLEMEISLVFQILAHLS